MTNIIVLLAIAALAQSKGSQCNQIINNDAVVSLEPLSNQDFTFKLKDNSQIYFRFCGTTNECSPNVTDASAVVRYPNATCTKVASYSGVISNNFEPLDADDLNIGIRFKLAGGDNEMSLNHVLYCNKDQPSLNVFSVTFKNNQFTVYSETQNACPLVRISGLSTLISDNIYIVALICIIVGIFECLYGKRLLQPTLFVIGYLCGFIFSLLIFRELLRNTDNIFYLWISMMISVLVGAFVGAVAMQLHKIGILVVGIGLGIVLALLFWTAVIAHLTNSVYLFYTLIVLFSLGCSILSWRIFDHVIIFSTSFMGSYLTFRAVSWIFSGFPNEFNLTQQIKSGQLQELPKTLYVYLVAILLFAAFGIKYQYQEWHLGPTTLQALYKEKMEKKGNYQNDQYVELQDLPDSIIQTNQPIAGFDSPKPRTQN